MSASARPNPNSSAILSPEAFFGFVPGADRRLIRWPALVSYFETIAEQSDRVIVDHLGPATGGQPLILLTISAPTNLARRHHLQAIQQRLANQRPPLGTTERARLLSEGRAICLITCSIHATEVGAVQMSPELVFRLATGTDATTRRILDEVVILLVPSLNPDGMELVADWYGRTLGTSAEGSAPPELYHPYAGHDNNRDWFMQVLTETRLLIQHAQNPWRPHIVYDLHQMQSNGPRYVVPPFVDPYDPNVDPLIQAQVNDLGTSIAAELIAEKKTGVATSIIFDAYSPSRSYQHYHGGVRILSEAASVRIASPIALSRDELVETRGFDPKVSTHNHPQPWEGGVWTLRDIVEHNLISAQAVLDHAARHRDRWVRNFALIQERSLHRDRPYAFVLPAEGHQRDRVALVELLQVLQAGDVEVERARQPFIADTVEYPAGTYVIRMGQPFGGFAKTLLEVQHYPDPRMYPGGPIRPPYDNTAHTLPLQMGVQAVRVETPFIAEIQLCEPVRLPAGGLSGPRVDRPVTVVSAESNASVALINRFFSLGAEISRCAAAATVEGRLIEPGAWIVEGLPANVIDRSARDVGLTVRASRDVPDLPLRRQTLPRLGVYHSWRPNAIDAGWTRLVLEHYGFPYLTLRDRDLRQGNVRARIDTLLLPQESAKHILEGNSASDYPPEHVGGIGELGSANIRRFVEEGGTLVTLDAACELAIRTLYLPVGNVLDGLRQDEFYSPGSLLRLLIDSSHPIGWGYERETVGMFVSSPTFEVRSWTGPEPHVVAQYPLGNQLLSGWMRGADHIAGRAALIDAPFGEGRAILFGFRPQFRAQSRVTYRLLFNSLYLAGLEG